MGAHIFTHPESVGEPPPWVSGMDFQEHWDQEKAWEQKVVDFAKAHGSGQYRGEVYRWQIADGYASYVVFRLKPLELIWLNTGDAWSMPDVVARGLTAADVKKQIGFERRWAELAAEQNS